MFTVLLENHRDHTKNLERIYTIDLMGNYHELTDDELAVLLRSGDNRAYTEIYNRYHGKLYVHVFHRLNSREDTKDLLHDLFISLWKNHASLILNTTLAAYLYTAARYRVFDFIAHKKVAYKYYSSLRDFVESGEYYTDHKVREAQLKASIAREIEALPAKMREIFNLSRVEHLSHKQIAEKLNLSEQTVKKQVTNALKVLRVKLGMSLFLFMI